MIMQNYKTVDLQSESDNYSKVWWPQKHLLLCLARSFLGINVNELKGTSFL